MLTVTAPHVVAVDESAFVAVAGRAVAVVSDLALNVFARALAAVSVVFVAFLAERAFALFALPAVAAERESACSFPPMIRC